MGMIDMMRRIAAVGIILVVSCLAATAARGVTVDTISFASLNVAGSPIQSMTSPYAYQSGNAFFGTLTSAAYLLPDQRYLYLYQADNNGTSPMELLHLRPFSSLDTGHMGWLTDDNLPAGFLAGGTTPLFVDYFPTEHGPTLSYLFSPAVPASGGRTPVLYLISSGPPMIGTGQLLDGGTATTAAWTASAVVSSPPPPGLVPEPLTLLGMMAGMTILGAYLLARSRRGILAVA
jgi:hypothetical protein